MGKITITNEWKTVEPMGHFYNDGPKDAEGNWKASVWIGVECRVNDAGMFCTRTTLRNVKGATGEESIKVTEREWFPADAGQRIGRKDGGEFVARQPGQFHIARVAG